MGLNEELQKLNEAQRAVVENLNQSLLVMAPAGTGKTNVISLRTAHFIQSGMSPNQILCLTFTNKACHELKDRLIKIIGADGKAVCVKTFHSLCYQLIKEEAKSLGKLSNDFMIIDEEDAKFVIKQLVSDAGVLSDKAYEYIQALKFYQIGRGEVDQDLISDFHQSESALRLYYTLKNSNQGNETLGYLSQYGWWLYEEYQRHLKEHHLLDFNDLLLYATDCLAQEEILKRWQSKFQVIVVDEVQDTSVVEYELIQKLALHSNFSAFGDFNQTIYEWRDSNPVLIRSKIMEDFNPICLELSLNYRATKRLVQMSANYLENGKRAHLINPSLSPKLIEAASDVLGTRPVFYEAGTKQEEMNFIIDHLKHHRQEDLAKTVILTRSNRQNSEVANFLKADGIPCYLVDQLSLFKRKSIKDLLAVVRFYLNPLDEVSLQRFIPLLFKSVDLTQMIHPQYLKRYKQYEMRLVDLFSKAAYEYKEPYGLLKQYYEKGRIIIFDVESTGLDVTKDEVIQIAAIELKEGIVVQSFERFIKPLNSVGESALVHGFSDEFLEAHGQSAYDVFQEFLQFIDGDLLIGHNVQYDLKIVRSHMNRVGLSFDTIVGYCDTLDIVRRLYPNLKNHKLDTVSDFIGVEHEPTHNAMDDILATKDVLVKSMERLMQCHEQRKKVMSYYQASLIPIVNQLEQINAWINQELPSQFLLKLIDEFKIWETAPWVEDEVEQMKLHELLACLREIEEQHLTDCPQLPMWELWTRILAQTSLSASELDRVMKDQNKLAVITVHQSKGLEFDHVIIPFLNQGMFPLDFNGTNQEEECRLFYVAMTRAKQTLLLTRHLKDYSYSKKEKERSQFIDFLYTQIGD